MNTINDIATKLRMLAAEVGGDHHTNKETEKLLEELAKDLDDININLSIDINKAISDIDAKYTGVTEQSRFITLRQRNIKENEEEM